MTNRISILLGGALVVATTPALADSAFDGTWVMVPDSEERSKVPGETTLANGTYTCVTCTPSYSVAADGKFHPVEGYNWFDAVAVTPVDANTLKYQWQKDGKVIGTEVDTVSADKSTISYRFDSINPVGGASYGETGTQTRVGSPVAGQHLAAGKWLTTKVTSDKAEDDSRTFQINGDTVTSSSPDGMTYTATLGGDFVPVKGIPEGEEVAVTMSSETTLTERWKRNGELRSIAIIEARPDGSAQDVTMFYVPNGTVRRLTAARK